VANAAEIIWADEQDIEMASNFIKIGIGNYDALHLASAIHGQANLFVSTDDSLRDASRTVSQKNAISQQYFRNVAWRSISFCGEMV